jgi:hypothetical protein
LCAAYFASAAVASDDEDAWYLDGSGVPVGWNERAVAFSEVPLPAGAVSAWIAPGAMVYTVLSIVEENVGQERWGSFTTVEESRVRLCGRSEQEAGWKKAGLYFH